MIERGLIIPMTAIAVCALIGIASILRPEFAVQCTLNSTRWWLRICGFEGEIKSTPRALTICRIWNSFMLVFMVMLGGTLFLAEWGGTAVIINNPSGNELRDIHISVNSDSRTIDRIAPGGISRMRIFPRGESDIKLEWSLAGSKDRHSWRGGYVESGGYKVKLTIDSSNQVQDETSLQGNYK